VNINIVNVAIITFAIVVVGVLIYKRVTDKPTEFKENYRIDLKQDGYLVYDPVRDTTVFVERDSLEEWFLKDNL
jgi:hypothetical protein